jgi:hypothetical protein
MEVEKPALTFPTAFCCNCGDKDCVNEVQETRVTRFFKIGRTDTTFQLDVPVCAGCRRTTKRRPAGFFSRLGVLLLITSVLFGVSLTLVTTAALPLWVGYFSAGSIALGLILTVVFYRLRRPKPPQTSFYQPVRIREAKLQFTGLMAGAGHVGYMKLAFTNPEYLDVFVNANQDAIKAKHVSVVKA